MPSTEARLGDSGLRDSQVNRRIIRKNRTMIGSPSPSEAQNRRPK